jgi:cytochrome c peroxidase
MSQSRARQRRWLAIVVVAMFAFALYEAWLRFSPPAAWSDAEKDILASLWLGNLPPLPADPTNAVADNPDAAALGHSLFFDARLSANGMISCSTCHQPIRNFSDGLPTAVAIGQSRRNTPSIVGTAYSPWLYWDGRKDSQWSQALAPLEDPDEHGFTRLQVLNIIASVSAYRKSYEELFGPPPDLLDPIEIDRAFANVGKAIAAYERLLMPGESRFDRYVEHILDGGDHREQEYLDSDEIRGLRLFISDARCTECHNGPLLTNNEFHNTGILSARGKLPDRGRIDGVREVLADPFNCLGVFNDDATAGCAELTYARKGIELIGATRTPSLRNLDATAPFQHQGQHATLDSVLQHYNDAPLAIIGHNEATELNLRQWELQAIAAFLGSLSAPIAAEEKWLQPPP